MLGIEIIVKWVKRARGGFAWKEILNKLPRDSTKNKAIDTNS